MTKLYLTDLSREELRAVSILYESVIMFARPHQHFLSKKYIQQRYSEQVYINLILKGWVREYGGSCRLTKKAIKALQRKNKTVLKAMENVNYGWLQSL